jgi:hypothetical protein
MSRILATILFSFFILMVTTQNGLNIVIYELAKPYIIEKYCINKQSPELHCNGKCHLAKVMTQDETDHPGDPLNVPAPEFKYLTLYFLGTHTGPMENYFQSTLNFFEVQPMYSRLRDLAVFHPPQV